MNNIYLLPNSVKEQKSDMRIFVENSHTADIQRFGLYWIAA